MDKKTLQNSILEKAYQPEKWLDVLKDYFGAKKFHQKPQTVSLPSNEIANRAVELGSFYTADERIVGIYEVKLTDKALIERNRVGLRNLFKSVIRYDLDAALIVYIQENKWRFSYVSEIRTAEGKKETEPKRYTYLFGEGESCRTAAERFDKLKGKPIYLNDLFEAFSVEKLNKDFFKTYKEFYEKFWKYLAADKQYNKLLSDKRYKDDEVKREKPIRDFAKKLLGRIVFLQFLQKKGWMGVPAKNTEWKGGDIKFLQSLFAVSKNKTVFHSKELRTLFFETLNDKRKNNIAPALLGKDIKIPYLNGGLFEKDLSFSNDVDFPEDYFANLLDFFEQYNFTIDENDPYDSEVGIDPEMLGHIFENLLEENREKGAFYTPKEIVHYMCQESLIEYLHTQLPNYNKADFELLVRNNQVSSAFAEYKTANEINNKLKAVKICDPAIGSGAFPMGLLKEIFECRRLLYGYLKTNDKFDPAQVKKDIIQQNIYGVDLENGAIEIARLRFWLALVVDEKEPEPLPNLDYKIIQGNSLLEQYEGIELGNTTLFSEPKAKIFQASMFEETKVEYGLFKGKQEDIKSLMNAYFKVEDKDKKAAIHKRIDNIVIDHIDKSLALFKTKLLIEIDGLEQTLKRKKELKRKSDNTIKEIEKRKKQLESKNAARKRLLDFEKTDERPYFLWHLYFMDVFEGGGFDVVIGNPPYIQLQKMTDEATLLQEAGYDTFTKSGDIYCLFYEQGNKLLKHNGNLCFITSNSWMKAKYGETLRNYFAQNTTPLKVINFEDSKIFQTAVVETNIMLFKKGTNNHKLEAVVVKSDYKIGNSINDYFLKNYVTIDDLDESEWIILSKQDYLIKTKIEQQPKLKELGYKIISGVKTGLNEAFLIDLEKRNELLLADKKNTEIIRPIIRGRDISKYKFSFNNVFCIYTHNGNYSLGISEINCKSSYPTVYNYLSSFGKKITERPSQGRHWSNVPTNYLEEFGSDKIIWGELSDKPKFALDTSHSLTEATVFNLTGSNLKYLLAILNSKLCQWYFETFTTTSGMGTNRWKKYKMEKIPIPRINDSSTHKFETLADYLNFLNDESKPPVNPYTDNVSIAAVFEDVVNMMVYELYFEEHMKQEEIDVLQFVNEKAFPALGKDEKANAEIIGKVYKTLQEQENPIRNRVILSNIRSKDIIRRINSTTH